jgi:hypothetical protein
MLHRLQTSFGFYNLIAKSLQRVRKWLGLVQYRYKPGEQMALVLVAQDFILKELYSGQALWYG